MILTAIILTIILTPLSILIYLNLKYPEPHWDWNKIDTTVTFPKGFLWGVATSAHQVEGGCDNNNWSEWERAVDESGKPRIKNGQRAGRACDHWNRYREDIALMLRLGVRAYRFSVEWSKIEPRRGELNEAALRHYQDLSEDLVAAGIEPMVTLHHFTNPVWFEKAGAFEKEENIAEVVAFALRVFDALNGKVRFWCTINEPDVYAAQGYFTGLFPPGKKDPHLAGLVLWNMLQAHDAIYHALKGRSVDPIEIGIVKNVFQFDPFNRWSLLDWRVSRTLNQLFNDSILSYLKDGHFRFKSPGMKSDLDKWAPEAKQVPQVQVPGPGPQRAGRLRPALDFIGLNYYSHLNVRFQRGSPNFFGFAYRPEEVRTDMTYTIYAEGFYGAIHEVAKIGVPIFVTENGIADFSDDRRELFLRQYLFAMRRAMDEGCDLRGYFYWSLMDNFEWTEGYDMKFGLFEVDVENQARSLRAGSKYFVEVVTPVG